jgi:hypothetical protein
MKNLEKGRAGINLGFDAAAQAVMSKRKSQVHFYVPTEQYKKLKRIGINKDMSIGDMFIEMLTSYIANNKDY